MFKILNENILLGLELKDNGGRQYRIENVRLLADRTCLILLLRYVGQSDLKAQPVQFNLPLADAAIRFSVKQTNVLLQEWLEQKAKIARTQLEIILKLLASSVATNDDLAQASDEAGPLLKVERIKSLEGHSAQKMQLLANEWFNSDQRLWLKDISKRSEQSAKPIYIRVTKNAASPSFLLELQRARLEAMCQGDFVAGISLTYLGRAIEKHCLWVLRNTDILRKIGIVGLEKLRVKVQLVPQDRDSPEPATSDSVSPKSVYSKKTFWFKPAPQVETARFDFNSDAMSARITCALNLKSASSGIMPQKNVRAVIVICFSNGLIMNQSQRIQFAADMAVHVDDVCWAVAQWVISP